MAKNDGSSKLVATAEVKYDFARGTNNYWRMERQGTYGENNKDIFPPTTLYLPKETYKTQPKAVTMNLNVEW